jgi:iron complex outermembrane receptor protein
MKLGAKMDMKCSLKISLCLGTALGTSLLFAEPTIAQQAPSSAQQAPSSAQQAPSSTQQQGPIEEVVVTARGRPENQQNVPIAVTAFSEQQIQDAHIREVGDFINLTPNVTIVQAQEAGYNAVTVRGITEVRNGESPVAVIVDGVEEVDSYQFTQELFDLQNIEVLKGPQGSLYGRDAEGGAILITTQQPTDTFEGHVQVGGGTGGEYDAQGVVSGPIVDDQLYFRLGANYVDRAGYFENTYLNKPEDPYQDLTVQTLLKWTPTSNFSADLRANISQTNGGALNYHLNVVNLYNANYYSDTFDSQYVGIDRRAIDEVSLKLDDDLGFGVLQSVSAYNHVSELSAGMYAPYGNYSNDANYTGSTSNGGCDILFAGCLVAPTQSQFLDVTSVSEDLRLTSPTDQKFRWMTGVYFLSTDRYISTTTDSDSSGGCTYSAITGYACTGGPVGLPIVYRAPGPQNVSFLGDNNHNVSMAGYINLDYDILSNVQLSAGYRYDQENNHQIVSPYQTPANGSPDGGAGVVNKATSDLGQPKFSATFKAMDNLSLYATWGVGFRSGEFNQYGLGNYEGQPTGSIRQESDTSEEIGFKSSWFSDRFTLNGDVFHTDVSNSEYFVYVYGLANGVNTQILLPIQKVDLQGAELEGQVKLMPGLDLYGSLGTTGSTVKEYLSNPADVGHWAPYIPDMTANVGAQYRTDLIKG